MVEETSNFITTMKTALKKNSAAPTKTQSHKTRAKKKNAIDFGSASRAAAELIEVSAVSDRNAESPTVIEARFDAGFGNGLFIRGEGADLSWDKGQPMVNVDQDVWRWMGKASDRVV